MTARYHHFLPQCYLKGFTCGKSKKSKLAVLDIKEDKAFETIPRNVGGVRDFNRIEIKGGVDPNYLEHELSKFENQVATALKNLRKTLDFSGETKDIILHFITLIALRSPEKREYIRQCEAQLTERIMGITHASKEIWESMEGNDKLKEYVSYEDSKKFFESKEYTIEVPREYHIYMELSLFDDILPCMFNRRWLLIIADEKSGPFITTDSPVNLLWKYPEKIPLCYRYSPGFGREGTMVYFPISQELALIGEFDGGERTVRATEDQVAMFNSNMLFNCPRQIYAPKFDFKCWGKENNILSGRELLKYI